VRRGGDQSTKQVENEKAPGTHTVFDVVPKDPEEERVAENVSPATVEKHRRERREVVDPIVVDRAGQLSGDNPEALANSRFVRQFARNHAEVAHAGRELDVGSRQAAPLHGKPNREHGPEDEPGHDRRAERRIFVGERDHVLSGVIKVGAAR